MMPHLTSSPSAKKVFQQASQTNLKFAFRSKDTTFFEPSLQFAKTFKENVVIINKQLQNLSKKFNMDNLIAESRPSFHHRSVGPLLKSQVAQSPLQTHAELGYIRLPMGYRLTSIPLESKKTVTFRHEFCGASFPKYLLGDLTRSYLRYWCLPSQNQTHLLHRREITNGK
jgi:hypothetical protein